MDGFRAAHAFFSSSTTSGSTVDQDLSISESASGGGIDQPVEGKFYVLSMSILVWQFSLLIL